MIKIAVARRYAKALFDLLDRSAAEPMRAALTGLAEEFSQSAQLRHVLASPAIAAEDKLDVVWALAASLGCPSAGKPFLAQLITKGRASFLPEIATAFGALVDEAKGTQQVTVSSAAGLSLEEQDRIQSRLRQLLHCDVDVTFHSDPHYVAGLHIRIGSTVIDSTVRGRLAAMQALLTKE